jgi:hypothetical protein
MDVYGRSPRRRADGQVVEEGEYFRANVWGWRPIHDLCNRAIEEAGLPFDTNGWAYNDGHGLATQEECDQLADALEAYLSENAPADGTFSVDLGMYHDGSGRLYSRAEAEGVPGLRTAHSTSAERVREWIAFLRNCGGFEIR